MKLNTINVEDLSFNPNGRGFVQDLKKAFPEFQATTTFHNKNLFTFIVIMYDKASNMEDRYPDYWMRKREAAIMAGFSFTDNRFKKTVEDMLTGLNNQVNGMIVRYIMQFADIEYSTLKLSWELYIKEALLVALASNSKESKEAFKNITDLHDKIKSISNGILGGVESDNLRRMLYKDVMNDMLRLRPELISQDLLDATMPMSDPYAATEEEDGE